MQTLGEGYSLIKFYITLSAHTLSISHTHTPKHIQTTNARDHLCEEYILTCATAAHIRIHKRTTFSGAVYEMCYVCARVYMFCMCRSTHTPTKKYLRKTLYTHRVYCSCIRSHTVGWNLHTYTYIYTRVYR